MPRYIALERWTDQGIRRFHESEERAGESAKFMAQLDVTMVEVYWTMGAYDLVSIVDAPDDEAISAVLLADAAKGNVRTTTFRAFSRAEMEEIVRRASGL